MLRTELATRRTPDPLDLDDIRSLREAKEAERDEPTVPLAEVKKALGLE
jgi:hypothetical protein